VPFLAADGASSPAEALYVHVPFCARKCAYCAFYSEAAPVGLIDRYVGALIRELDCVAWRGQPRTVFFGGGTPSLLTLRQWKHILAAMGRLGLLGAKEWTVECNPATLSLEKARLLLSFGVNRISMGVQSLDDALLDRLGRIHTRDQVFRSFDLLRRAGCSNVNLDLMFGIPGQTLGTWRTTLREALALESEHLSTYEVVYEDDTPLFRQLKAGTVTENEDLNCAMYEALLEATARAGFQQYEVANFARVRPGSPGEVPDLACQHNVNYWRGGSFHGLGPGATGYVGGVRTKNVANTRLYCDAIEAGHRAVESREELAPQARAGETAAFGLRMTAGWPFELFRQVTGFELRDEWCVDMEELVRRGWGRIGEDRFQLTREGLRFADAAAELFLRP
jgi:oxygen-independent coproporphyrinogen-3 oxidase